jgi:hypothetical protein
MRDIIQRHNRLNGLVFCIVEFGLIALAGAAFGTFCLVRHRALLAVISWGIALNCVPVVYFAICAWRQARRTGEPVGSFWDKKARARHLQENPHMLRDTFLLTVATALPFVNLAAVLIDRVKPSKP